MIPFASATTQMTMVYSTNSNSPTQLVVDVTYVPANGNLEWTSQTAGQSYYFSIGLTQGKLYCLQYGDGFKYDFYTLFLKYGTTQIFMAGYRGLNEFNSLWIFKAQYTGIYTLELAPNSNNYNSVSFGGFGFFEIAETSLDTIASGSKIDTKYAGLSDIATVGLIKTAEPGLYKPTYTTDGSIRYFDLGNSLSVDTPTRLSSSVGNPFSMSGIATSTDNNYFVFWTQSNSLPRLYLVPDTTTTRNSGIDGFQPLILIGVGCMVLFTMNKKMKKKST